MVLRDFLMDLQYVDFNGLWLRVLVVSSASVKSQFIERCWIYDSQVIPTWRWIWQSNNLVQDAQTIGQWMEFQILTKKINHYKVNFCSKLIPRTFLMTCNFIWDHFKTIKQIKIIHLYIFVHWRVNNIYKKQATRSNSFPKQISDFTGKNSVVLNFTLYDFWISMKN